MTDHRKILDAMPIVALGLATDEEQRAFDEHVSGCESCHESWTTIRDAHRADDIDDVGHLPPALVAAWSVRAPKLQGVVRDAVGRHLERCSTCRSDLETFGHEPVLPPLAFETSTAPRPVGQPRRAWWPGFWTGLGVSAAAALLAVFLLPPMGPDDAPTAIPWTFSSTTRGGGDGLSVAASVERVIVAVNWPMAASGRVVVTSPTGDPLVSTPVDVASVSSETAMIVVPRPPDGWESGAYAVIATSGDRTVASEFRLDAVD